MGGGVVSGRDEQAVVAASAVQTIEILRRCRTIG
jgi:hypothetical protein